MKKLLAVLMVLSLAAVSFAALAENEPAVPPAPDPDPYSGVWECDRATAEIVWEEEGYRVQISWGSSAWETTTWEYSCYYHEDDGTMVSMPFGSRTEWVYDDSGEVVSAKTVYDDGVAVFSLDQEGRLIWQDEKENAGEGLRFDWVSEYPPVDTETENG